MNATDRHSSISSTLPDHPLTRRLVLVAAIALSLAWAATAQVTLTGGSYTENFDTIGAGLPAGWSVRTNANATSLGTLANLTPTNTWGDNAAEFRNCAALTNNSGGLATGSESSAQQAAFTNRVLAVRQGASFGDPGAAFVFQAANTVGLTNFTVGMDMNLLRSNANSTVWTVDYAVGNSPASFTPLGTFGDPGAVGVIRQTYNLGADANNQAQNLWIRVVALNATTNGGVRDTFGIDNFELTYNNPAPARIPLYIQPSGGSVVVRWDNPSFNLESAPAVTGAYTNVPGATSPYTNTITGNRKYFRLKYP